MITDALEVRLHAARAAARSLRALPTETKNAVLTASARRLGEREAAILAANAADLAALSGPAATEAFRDRLLLTPARLVGMAESLRQVAALPDPVGETVESRVLSNGLRTRRVRSPLGVILMIFESRPNVATEAFSLAFKSGNVTILRGGKESMRTTAELYAVLTESLLETGADPACLWGITDPDRALTEALLKQERFIDVVVPRGGDSLIDFVTRSTRIPIIKNDRGLCHVYVHEDADLDMAERIVINAKRSRPGVCNSMETLLVHRAVASEFLPRLHARLESAPTVEWFVDTEAGAALAGRAHVQLARAESWDTEYLAFKMNCAVVDSLEAAIAHIEAHGSRHSESIVTRSERAARLFQSEVDAAAVYWNASTRFTDGFELGLGGELGISTQKLHVRGPVGLRELTSVRWVVDGDGQIR